MDLFWVLGFRHAASGRLPQSPVLSLICPGNTSSSLSLSVRICIVLAQWLLPYLIPLTMQCECSGSFLLAGSGCSPLLVR